jgi:GxxExxY protein
MDPVGSGPDLIEEDLTHEIIAAFLRVYNTFGFGLLESIYANALAIDLRARGYHVEREVPVEVYYLGVLAGRFRLDLVVDGKILVECKASELLSPVARPQVFNYLKCASYPIALLLHFGPTPKPHRFIKPDVLPRA